MRRKTGRVPFVFGPHAPLSKATGSSFSPWSHTDADVSPGTAEVIQTDKVRVLASVGLPQRLDGSHVDVPLRLDATEFGLEFRLSTNGRTGLSPLMGVELLRIGHNSTGLLRY